MKTMEKKYTAKKILVKGLTEAAMAPTKVTYHAASGARSVLELADAALMGIEYGAYEATNAISNKIKSEPEYFDPEMEEIHQDVILTMGEMKNKIYHRSTNMVVVK